MARVSGGPPKANYTRDEVCRLLGIRESVLEDWEDNGFVARAEQYAFKDLVALKTLRQLRARRMPAARIRLILESLRSKLRHVADPLQELKIYTDGRRLAVQVDGHRMEPLTGQLLLDFDQDELRRLLEFPSKRAERTLAQEMEHRMREAEQWFERAVEMEQTGAPPEQIIAAYEKALERDPAAPAPHTLGRAPANSLWSRHPAPVVQDHLQVQKGSAEAQGRSPRSKGDRGHRRAELERGGA